MRCFHHAEARHHHHERPCALRSGATSAFASRAHIATNRRPPFVMDPQAVAAAAGATGGVCFTVVAVAVAGLVFTLSLSAQAASLLYVAH